MTRTSHWSQAVSPAVLGTAACAACCSVPLVAAVAGAGAASTVAAVAEPVAGVLLAATLVVGGVTVVRGRLASAGAADPACSVDGSCGCGPAIDEKTAREAGCTLEASAMPDRGQAFRALFSRGLLRREAARDSTTWTFTWSTELEDEARALAAAESGCCSFFEFDIRRVGDELRWTTRVPAGREPALDLLDRFAAEVAPSA